jgi:GNAT superfamily N-acetyltransferase
VGEGGVRGDWMNIRKAGSSDIPVLAAMNRRLIRDEGHRNSMTVPDLARRMRRWLRREYQAWMFMEGEHPFGYCLFRREGEFLYIRQFYVQGRSRRRGLGSKAFRWLGKNVWGKDKLLRLDVLIGNRSGILFWKKAGFKEYCLTMERKNP